MASPRKATPSPTGNGAAGPVPNTQEADLSPSLGSGVVPAGISRAEEDGESATSDPVEPTAYRNSQTGRFLPGNNANPKGRPKKGESYLERLEKTVNRKAGKLADAIVEAALEKNVRAHVFIRDTLYGIPEQKLRISQEESPLDKLFARMQERRTIEGEYTVSESVKAYTLEQQDAGTASLKLSSTPGSVAENQEAEE